MMKLKIIFTLSLLLVSVLHLNESAKTYQKREIISSNKTSKATMMTHQQFTTVAFNKTGKVTAGVKISVNKSQSDKIFTNQITAETINNTTLLDLDFSQLNVSTNFSVNSLIIDTLQKYTKAQFIIITNITFLDGDCTVNLNLTVNNKSIEFDFSKRVLQLTVQLRSILCFEKLSTILVNNSEVLGRTILSLSNLNMTNLKPLRKLLNFTSYESLYGIDLSQNKFEKVDMNSNSMLPMNIRFINISSCKNLDMSDSFFERFPQLEYLEMYDVPDFGRLVFASRSVAIKFPQSTNKVNLSVIFKAAQAPNVYTKEKCLVEIGFFNHSLFIKNCDTLEFKNIEEDPGQDLFIFKYFRVLNIIQINTVDLMLKRISSNNKILGVNNLSRIEFDHIGNMDRKFHYGKILEHMINIDTLSLFANELVSINLTNLPFTILSTLDLSNNRIETLVSSSMSGQSDNNSVYFEKFVKLTHVLLNNNRLKIINKLVFSKAVAEIRLVNLRHNQLTTLNEIRLPTNTSRVKILLDYNNLKDLPFFSTGESKTKVTIEELSMSNQLEGMFRGEENNTSNNASDTENTIRLLNLSENGLHTTNRRFLHFITHTLLTSIMNRSNILDSQTKNSLVIDFIDLSQNQLFVYSICDLYRYLYDKYDTFVEQPRRIIQLKMFPVQRVSNDLFANGKIFPSNCYLNCHMDYVLNHLIHRAFRITPNRSSPEDHYVKVVNKENGPNLNKSFQQCIGNPNSSNSNSCGVNLEKRFKDNSLWIAKYCTHISKTDTKFNTKFEEELHFFDETVKPLLFKDYFYFMMVYMVLFFFFYMIFRRFRSIHNEKKKMLKKLDSDQLLLYYDYLKTVLQKE